MTFSLFETSLDTDNKKIKDALECLLEAGLVYDEENPDIILFFGGDGTFLRCVQANLNRLNSIYLLGIAMGGTCFYYDYDIDHVATLVKDLLGEECFYINLPLLKLEVMSKGESSMHYAVNDIRIMSEEKTIKAHIAIGYDELEYYRGSGLCFATPSGSTGFNKSIGGAILDESIPGFTMSEIAPMNNYMVSSLRSPLVLRKDKNVDVIFEKCPPFKILYDNNVIDGEGIEALTVTLSTKKVRLARSPRYSFGEHISSLLLKEGDDGGDY
ncbi:MAG: NAD(+)/NADH kinase [Coprobacillus sp.]|nr:NAD(+)/NADH kinase [Coprobacillus sp.]